MSEGHITPEFEIIPPVILTIYFVYDHELGQLEQVAPHPIRLVISTILVSIGPTVLAAWNTIKSIPLRYLGLTASIVGGLCFNFFCDFISFSFKNNT